MDDDVQVVGGHCRSHQISKVAQVYRKKYVPYTECVQQENTNNTCVHVSTHPKLKLDNHGKKKIARVESQFSLTKQG